jgi:preprotein translocase subunit SecE
MGRLKRKRPASSKKRGRKKAAKKNSEQGGALQKEVSNGGLPQRIAETKPKTVIPKKDVPKAIKPSGRRSDVGLWTKTVQFLREVKIELKKVTWPSRKEAMASTVVVIILVVIVSAFLGLVDVGLSSLIRAVLH